MFYSSNPKASERPVISLMPGGPGLSSATLGTLKKLNSEFDLALVDPPGTGGTPDLWDLRFESVCDSIELGLRDLNRPIVIGGLCYGGLIS